MRIPLIVPLAACLNARMNEAARGTWRKRGTIAACFALFAFVFWRTAWLSDDAYISYRTVDNLVNGYGLRYNVFERVQTFTNPLWIFWNAALYVFTREGFYTFVAVCVGTSLAALLVALGAMRNARSAFALACMLVSSRAFVDFATSGMENPLSYLLAAAFVFVFLRCAPGARTVLLLSLIAALAAVNRLDSVLLFAPALLLAFWNARGKAAFAALCAGMLPLAAWLGFSLVYYGFLFPNTAYAKLWIGRPEIVMLRQGGHYLMATVYADPVTPIVIAAACAAVLLRRSAAHATLLAGALLYVAYAVHAGGDFMLGRFFSVPYLLCAMLLADAAADVRWKFSTPAFACGALAALLVPHASLNDALLQRIPEGKYYDGAGVWDMRLAFSHTCGTYFAKPGQPMPMHEYAIDGRRLRAEAKPRTGLYGAAGMRAFFAGPEFRLVDMHALTDPLLARLPPIDNPSAAIGHLRRFIPPGYMKSVETGQNLIQDPKAKALYEDLRVGTQGPLWTSPRWRAIFRLNLYPKSYGIDDAFYRKYRPK